MKRKKKDLNQHSWKVSYLTVSYRWFCTVKKVNWQRSEFDAEITSEDQRTERWMAVLLITGFLGSAWLGDNAGEKERSSCFVFLRFSILYQQYMRRF